MKLCELLEGIVDAELGPYSEADITRVTADSRRVNKGSVFVALQGKIRDGNDYIDEAIHRGVNVIISERDLAKIENCLVINTKNARKMLALLSARINGNPEKKLSFIGITGTKGKSTTTEFLLSILTSFGVNAISIGTLGVRGKMSEKTENTTPASEELFAILSRAVINGVTTVVVELSSQALFDLRAYGITFEIAIFTNISRDHIGGSEHESFSEYLNAKRSLFTSYGVETGIVNRDDAFFSLFMLGKRKNIKCGFNRDSDFLISDYTECERGASFRVSGIPLCIGMPGKYNAMNASLALAAASEYLGIGIQELAPYIKDVKIEGRFETHTVCDRRVIIDYAHNSDSFYRISKLVRSLFSGRIIAVFGSVGERGEDRRRMLGGAAESSFDFSVITMDDPGRELPLKICNDIYSSFFDKTRAKVITERCLAIEYALSIAYPGKDTVLLLGKGHEEYININGKKIEFSERRILSDLNIRGLC